MKAIRLALALSSALAMMAAGGSAAQASGSFNDDISFGQITFHGKPALNVVASMDCHAPCTISFKLSCRSDAFDGTSSEDDPGTGSETADGFCTNPPMNYHNWVLAQLVGSATYPDGIHVNFEKRSTWRP